MTTRRCAYTWAYSRVFYVPWYVYKYTVCRRIQEKSDALCTERIALTDDVCIVFDETRTTR